MLETSTQARYVIPMAVSLAFGIVFATVITLFLIPSLYMLLDDSFRLGQRIRSGWHRYWALVLNREPAATAGESPANRQFEG